MGALIIMKKIKLLRRTHVDRVGIFDAGKEAPCSDETAAHLVKSKHAEYATEKDAKAAEAEAKKSS